MPFVPSVPRAFNSRAIQENAPAMPGVYGLSNATSWLYIGQSDNIQRSLMELLGPGASTGAYPTGFVYEVCEPAARGNRQARLVLEYRPVGNRTGEGAR